MLAISSCAAASALRAAPLRLAPGAQRRTLCQFIPLPDHLQVLQEELTTDEAQLFDVREEHEAARGKLCQARLVPLSRLQDGWMPPHDRTVKTYVHCAAGVRVHAAAPILEALGFERVIPLQEGFATLANLGFDLAD